MAQQVEIYAVYMAIRYTANPSRWWQSSRFGRCCLPAIMSASDSCQMQRSRPTTSVKVPKFSLFHVFQHPPPAADMFPPVSTMMKQFILPCARVMSVRHNDATGTPLHRLQRHTLSSTRGDEASPGDNVCFECARPLCYENLITLVFDCHGT